MADIRTADIFDAHEDAGNARSCETQFRQFGGHAEMAGPVRTVKCYEDNTLVKKTLSEPGNGAVLVVDGGGSLRSALLGDMIGEMAVKNGWNGVLIWGAVRDTLALKELDISIKAIGTNPRRSRKDGAGQVGVSVTFGGVTFTPGAWVYSDDDGVLVADSELK